VEWFLIVMLLSAGCFKVVLV